VQRAKLGHREAPEASGQLPMPSQRARCENRSVKTKSTVINRAQSLFCECSDGCNTLQANCALNASKGSDELRRLGQRSLLDEVAQAALGAGSFVGMDDALGCGLIQQFAKRSELGPCRIEFLGLDSGLQLFDGSLEGGLRSTVATAALERLAKPLLGTLDIWHDNNS